jgi:hypothetical protein
MEGTSIIETTLGDLVEAVTQIALEAGKSEAEGYELASLTVEHILRRIRQKAVEETVL